MPDTLNRRDLAAACSVSPRTITDWIADGLPAVQVGRRILFDPVAVIGWLAQRAVQQQGRMDLNQERAALARVQTERQALALARERRGLVSRADVIMVWSNNLSVWRARLWALPVRLAAQVGSTTDERARIEATSRQHIRELLTEMATTSFTPDAEDTDDVEQPVAELSGSARPGARGAGGDQAAEPGRGLARNGTAGRRPRRAPAPSR